MRLLAYLLVCLTAAGCVLEDRPVASDGGADGGPFCVDCEGDTPVCNESTGLCVQCTLEETGECGGNTPVCNESTGLCVQCTPDETGACGGDTPVCNESSCVQCTPEETGACGGDTPLCDPGLFACVECLGSADCDDPMAAKCDDVLKECVPCDDRAQCDDVDGFPGTANACAEGECVDCTPESEEASCPGDPVWFVCNPDTNTCTNTPAGGQMQCETCVFDSECGNDGVPSEDFRCVPMFYPDESTRFPDAETGFCLKIFEPGGCIQPYAITISDRPSLSDPTLRSYCGINEELATCDAVRALFANEDCQDDSDCPTSGICRDVGGLSDKCTYLCESLVECLRNVPQGRPGSTCGDGDTGGDDFCGG